MLNPNSQYKSSLPFSLITTRENTSDVPLLPSTCKFKASSQNLVLLLGPAWLVELSCLSSPHTVKDNRQTKLEKTHIKNFKIGFLKQVSMQPGQQIINDCYWGCLLIILCAFLTSVKLHIFPTYFCITLCQKAKPLLVAFVCTPYRRYWENSACSLTESQPWGKHLFLAYPCSGTSLPNTTGANPLLSSCKLESQDLSGSTHSRAFSPWGLAVLPEVPQYTLPICALTPGEWGWQHRGRKEVTPNCPRGFMQPQCHKPSLSPEHSSLSCVGRTLLHLCPDWPALAKGCSRLKGTHSHCSFPPVIILFRMANDKGLACLIYLRHISNIISLPVLL